VSDDPYCFPGTRTLINRLGLTDPGKLDQAERRLVANRFSEGAPTGRFDLKHLRAIHRHLFQDVYDWAGDIRTLEISKGGSQFMFCKFIETGMADVHRRVVESRFLQALSVDSFAAKAGEIIGDINHIHPFREGNGRTQMTYLQQLGEQAGHRIDIRRIHRERWYAASRDAHLGKFNLMAAQIKGAIIASES
jgi:cell filamentation protein